jgi:competence protein ComEC
MGLLHWRAQLPGLAELGLSAWLALGLLLLARRRPRLALLASLVAALWLGHGYAAWRAQMRLAERLPASLDGQVMSLTGRVAGLPQGLSGFGGAPGWRFEFELDAGRPATVPAHLLVSCHQMPQAPRSGDHWQLPLKLRRPQGLMNPQGWDQALWLLQQDLAGSASCRSQGQVLLQPGPAWGLQAARQALREAIAAAVPDGRSAGVLAALSLGDQSAVARPDWALFRDTAVAHLLSVSGLHITMLAWLAALVAGRAWRRSAWLCLRWPAPRAAMWVGVAVALLYSAFSGWGVPAQRTCWLLLGLALLRQAGLRWPWPLSLLAAGLGVCLLDPWALTQAGFWLSFGAVALLMAAEQPRRPGLWQWLLEAWRTQWLLTLGLAPLGLLLFQQFSLIGLLANALAIPLVSYLITPLALAGALVPPLWSLAAWLVRGLMLWLEWLQAWPGAVWHLPWAPPWAQALGLLGGVLLAMPWALRLRLAGAGLCLPRLWPVLARPGPGGLELWLPDVGQGGAVLLRTQGHSLLYDAGPQWAPGSDAGQRVLLPLLRGLGERQLDLLLISHADRDHAGGAASVRAGLPVRQELGPWGRPCQAGQAWRWDGVDFELLHPLAQDAGRSLRSNALSCVLRVTVGGRRLLLTGDIEAAQEAQLLAREGAAGLSAELVLVPHHGSRSSSSAPFVAAVAPRLALVQAGHLNAFGHPRPEVLARWRGQGAEVLSTVSCGAWRWRSQAEAGPPWRDCERVLRRRYWLTPPPEALAGEADEAGEAWLP